VTIFDLTGAKLRNLSDDGKYVWSVTFSTDGTRLATAGVSSKIFVRDTTKWDVTYVLPLGGFCRGSVCFDSAGDYVAASSMNDVVVHPLDEGAEQRFTDVNAMGGLHFLADGCFLIAAGAIGFPTFPGYDRLVVLSRTTGAEADCSATFVPMALPPGTLNGSTLAISSNGSVPESLQVVVGSELIEIDVGLVCRAIDDVAWGYEQLVQLTDTAELSTVGELIGGALHCLNIRDGATGDTLMHHCVNTGNTALAAACLAPEGSVFVPIANVEGKTALHVAFERREQPLARAMAESLTPHLNDDTAALLTSALAATAMSMPEAVLPLLNAIEATVLVEHATARTLYHRPEVIGLDCVATTVTVGSDLKNPDTFESERAGPGFVSSTGLDLAAWTETFSSTDKHSTYTLVSFKTLMLVDLGGDPGGSNAFRDMPSLPTATRRCSTPSCCSTWSSTNLRRTCSQRCAGRCFCTPERSFWPPWLHWPARGRLRAVQRGTGSTSIFAGAT
jgi:hypothetical protein